MNALKWLNILLILTFISMGFVYIINYVVDPFNVFHTTFLKHQKTLNERFMKIEYLEEKHNNYNSYLFGSSRIGTTDPAIIENYIPNSHFYNFALSTASFYDYITYLKYFIRNKYPINNLYLQLDIDNMNIYKAGGFHRKPHPYVINEELNGFYLEHLSGFFPLTIEEKIKENLFYKDKNRKGYDLETGVWSRPDKEEKIINNCKKYVKNEPTFHQKRMRTLNFINKNKSIKALEEIKYLCNKHNINLYVFTMPHNKNMMDTFKTDDYLFFLKQISSVTDFIDFSGYNTITTNNCNYYEWSHYRPKVAKIIAARIFHDKSISVPSDFGILVTQDNIDMHLDNLRKQIKTRDLNSQP